MFGSEYDWRRVDAAGGSTPQFHGGDVAATWLVTGETRPYNAFSATFQGISPSRRVFEGGPGAWEAVLHLSYADFDSGSLQGGKLWRVTPMANWYLNDNMRWSSLRVTADSIVSASKGTRSSSRPGSR
jgi:phosphate-selective porin OprO/OprP